MVARLAIDFEVGASPVPSCSVRAGQGWLTMQGAAAQIARAFIKKADRRAGMRRGLLGSPCPRNCSSANRAIVLCIGSARFARRGKLATDFSIHFDQWIDINEINTFDLACATAAA